MSSINGLSTTGLNFTGLATGIDTQKIIDGLNSFNQKRIDTLRAREAQVQSKQALFSTIQSNLFDLQSKTGTLARSIAGAFDVKKATVSDEKIVTAAAGSSATPGQYSVTVGALAQAAQIASQGFADNNAQIKTGTFTFQVGTGTATSVTIDSRNNTLQGLVSAINNSGGDLKASVVNDGSGSTPYRLLLTANKTGAANTIAITNNLTTGTGSAVDATNRVVQAAADASVTLGSGVGALTVTSTTNQVSNLINGVTLNLVSADANKPVSIQVANDTSGAVTAVDNFVKSYNTSVDFINTQSKFDTATQQGGQLLGNSDAVQLKDDLAAALNVSIPGLNPGANRLSTAGITLGDDGKLVFNSATLTSTLNGETGATPADVKRLFGLTGTSDNPGVQFTLGTDRTRGTSVSPFVVRISNPATRAQAVGIVPVAPTITLDDTNNSFTISLNGYTSSSIVINPGDYTPGGLAAHIQQKINANSALNGGFVKVDLDPDGKLRVSSQEYGTAQRVRIIGGSAIGTGKPLGFVGGESGQGTDVQGNFGVGNTTEAATGSGQTLTGSFSNANTSGLQVKSTLDAAGTANVTVTKGLASRINDVLNKYLDPSKGRLKAIDDTFQASVDDFEKTISRQNKVLTDQTTRLQQQFADMETAVNSLKGIQSQLGSFSVLGYQ